MKRGLIAAAILGLTALPASAGDLYAPYPGYSTTGTASSEPVYRPHTYWRAGLAENGTSGGCATCGSGTERSFHERMEKLRDFLAYKPTIPCDPCPKPTPYMPPLRSWFVPRANSNCGCDKSNVTYGIMGRRYASCGSCASCGVNASAAPVIQTTSASAQTGAPLSPLLTLPIRPSTTPVSPYGTVSYNVSKPVNSNSLQPLLMPTPPPSYLPGSFVQPRN